MNAFVKKVGNTIHLKVFFAWNCFQKNNSNFHVWHKPISNLFFHSLYFAFFFVIKCSNYGEKYADVNWDELGFSLTPTDYMFEMKCSQGEEFSQGNLIPYGKIELSPAAAILNYGQVSSKCNFYMRELKHNKLELQLFLFINQT